MNKEFLKSLSVCSIQSHLKSTIDFAFKDIPELTIPVFQPKEKVEGKLCPAAGKQVYFPTPDQILRYDHTHVLLDLDCSALPATRVWGPVFRNGPHSSMRWKEFLQYDIDGLESVYGATLIKRGLQILKQIDSKFYVKVTGFDKKEISDWPLPIVYDDLTRDQSYYSGPVFEVFHPSYSCAFMAGGTYYRGAERVIGFSFGITRLTKLIIDFDLIPSVPIGLCYIKSGTSEKICNVFRKRGISVFPVLHKKNLRKDVQKMSTILKKIGYSVKFTIIQGPNELKTDQYRYKFPGFREKIYSLDELASELFKNYFSSSS